MNKVTPFLWLKDNAAEAIEFYQKLFKNTSVHSLKKRPDGTFFYGTIEILGQSLTLFNGGDHFTLNPAFSLYIDCDNQDEVDYYWRSFIEDGGIPSQCGWLTDKYGISWQVIPKILPELLQNPETAQKAMGAMFNMTRIIVKELEEAIKK